MIKKLLKRIWIRLLVLVGLLPEGTDDVINLSKIIVPKDIYASHPSRSKVNTFEARYNLLHHIDKPIEISMITYLKTPQYYLTDHYIRYLIARKHGVKKVPVSYINGR